MPWEWLCQAPHPRRGQRTLPARCPAAAQIRCWVLAPGGERLGRLGGCWGVGFGRRALEASLEFSVDLTWGAQGHPQEPSPQQALQGRRALGE